MLETKGEVKVHTMFEKTCGTANAWGVNEAKLKPGKITYASIKVEDGELHFFDGSANITGESADRSFFGVYGVAEFKDLEELMMFVQKENYHHHVSYTYGDEVEVLNEALTTYLGYKGKTF